MQEFFTLIANFGFPIVVAGYLLFRFENKIEKLDDSISGDKGLNVLVRQLTVEVRGLKQEVRRMRNGK